MRGLLRGVSHGMYTDTKSPETDATSAAHPFDAHVNPHLGAMLRLLKLDKRFVRGDGMELVDADGRRYLDFLSGYGALPFGHNPRPIWEALDAVRHAMEPNLVQPSRLDAAGELAARLLAVAPGFARVTYANSGAEAIEVAIKLARSRTGRRGVLTTKNSFHGKTLGALSATGNPKYQRPFGAPVAGFEHVPFGDLDALDEALAGGDQALFLVEPIQGEGGIHVPPLGYLAEAARLCHARGALFALDEIQTGLGRTGALFEYLREGLTPDLLTFGKAIGGGLVPLAGCLSTREVFNEDFGLLHSSTFAGNTLACRAGLAVIDLLERDDRALVRAVAENGAWLKAGLDALRRRHPDLVRDVRGRGYLLGVEFGGDRHAWPSSLFGYAASEGHLAPLVAGYLANVERVRVAPTLNGARVLRVEPPLIASRAHCEDFLAAFGRALDALATFDAGWFLASILDGAPRVAGARQTAPKVAPKAPPTPEPGDGRFGFLVHPLDLASYVDLDPTLATLAPGELAEAMGDLRAVFDPFVCSEVRVESARGRAACGEVVVVPWTAAQLSAGPPERALGVLRSAVDLARQRGARIVGLGAFTSIVTGGGRRLMDLGVPLTTGNSYTVAAAHAGITHACARLGLPLADVRAAVIGAGGAIGRAMSLMLAEGVRDLTLIGNPAQRPNVRDRQLRRLVGDLVRHLADRGRRGQTFVEGTLASEATRRAGLPFANAPVEAYEGFGERLCADGWIRLGGPVREAALVVTATSSLGSILDPEDLGRGAVVCDLARPRNVRPDLVQTRPDVLVFDGGIVELPGRPDLGPIGLAPGLAYGCMAETVLLALAGRYEHLSLGADLDPDTILELRAMAEAEGFGATALRSFDRPLTDDDLARVVAHRNAPAT